MICKNCGSEIAESENFCPICGAKVEADAPQNKSDIPVPFGIALTALILCEIPIVGLILAIIAKAKVNNFKKAGGQIVGLAKAAHILAKLALIFAIIAIVSWVFFIAEIAILGALGSGMSDIIGGTI